MNGAAAAAEEEAAEEGKITITIETEGGEVTPGSVGLCGAMYRRGRLCQWIHLFEQ